MPVSQAQSPFRARPDGASDPAGEAGWFLQRERERHGLGLEDVYEQTGIHPHHLEAIELGDLTRLPARIEALKMAGLYAQYLGFDPEPLVYHYAAILPKPQLNQAHPADPQPLSSAKVIKFARLAKFLPRSGGPGGLVASVLAAVLLFGGAAWMLKPGLESLENQQVAVIADPLPTASTDNDAGAVVVAESEMPDELPPLPGEADAPPRASPAEVAGLTEFIEEKLPESRTKIETETAAGWSETTPEGRRFGIENGASRLVLKAKAPVWVRIEDQQGNVVMTQMLMKGDSYKVPDLQGLVLIARDGGLIAYEIDGKERGILGPPGEILVGRPLDLDSLDQPG